MNGVKPPAATFVVPPASVGANGRLAPGHGPPFGPEVMSNSELVGTGLFSDHGANDAVVV